MSNFYDYESVQFKMPDSAWRIRMWTDENNQIHVGLFWNDKPHATHEKLIEKSEMQKVMKILGVVTK